MAEEIYKRLARHLDELPGGFPATESGVEIRILKKLFTPEEAAMAVHATLIPESPKVLARRARIPLAEAEERLDRMSRTGLLMTSERKGEEPKYMAAQFVVGIWEYHVNSLDVELIELMNEYLPSLVDQNAWSKVPQIRPIPVGKSIEVRHSAMLYEKAEEIIKAQKKILVAPCICRKEHQMVGKGCDRIMDACLIFGAAANFYLKNSIGRIITTEEALGILETAEKQGLVVQPSFAKKPINICLCCGCCCQVLKGMKKLGEPAKVFSSAFIARLDAEKCIGCGKCVKRCQMEALSMNGEKVELKLTHCLGCGLCVTSCPTDALVLDRKPEQPKVPENFVQTMLEHGRARGKLGNASLAWMALKSKLDRLLA